MSDPGLNKFIRPPANGLCCLCGLVALAILAANSAELRAQGTEAVDVVKVNTELVVFDVQVFDRKTRKIIGDLTASDFEIRDRGTKQDLTYFSHDELPLSILLLLDVSDSVRPFVQRIRDGALDALGHLKTEDQVAVMAFATWPELIQDFSTDRNLVARQIGEATTGQRLGTQTNFARAMSDAALVTMQPPHGNRLAIIVVTDNFFFTYAGQEKKILADLFQSGAVVYGLTVNTSNPAVALRGGYYPGLQRYVDQTGGEVLSANNRDVAAKLAVLIDRLRLRYVVGFRPLDTKEDVKFRSVEIKLTSNQRTNKDTVVLTKRGYYFRRHTN